MSKVSIPVAGGYEYINPALVDHIKSYQRKDITDDMAVAAGYESAEDMNARLHKDGPITGIKLYQKGAKGDLRMVFTFYEPFMIKNIVNGGGKIPEHGDCKVAKSAEQSYDYGTVFAWGVTLPMMAFLFSLLLLGMYFDVSKKK